MSGRSISDLVGGLAERWQNVLLAVVTLLVVVSVITTWIRTRSWVPTIGAALIGAVALWATAGVEDVQRSVEREIHDAPRYDAG
jgi:hypothetical protein